MKTPQYLLDRAAGLTTEEHEYIAVQGHRVALTAKQLERGWYTPLWRARKAYADAWHAVKNLPAGTHSYDRMLAEQRVNDARFELGRMMLLHYQYKRVPRCHACNKKIDSTLVADARTKPRCALCLSHFRQRIKYDNKVDRARSHALEAAALKDKKRAKHCPCCHYLRPKDSYINFNDPHGKCELCRDKEQWALGKGRREARLNRQAAKFAEAAMERARAYDEQMKRKLEEKDNE